MTAAGGRGRGRLWRRSQCQREISRWGYLSTRATFTFSDSWMKWRAGNPKTSEGRKANRGQEQDTEIPKGLDLHVRGDKKSSCTTGGDSKETCLACPWNWEWRASSRHSWPQGDRWRTVSQIHASCTILNQSHLGRKCHSERPWVDSALFALQPAEWQVHPGR